LGIVIGALGLGVASYTAWHQFSPVSDKLTVTSEGRTRLNVPVKIIENATIDPHSGKAVPVIGPIFWKFRIYNSSDRVVSIVKFDVFYIPENGSKAQYSSMNAELLRYETPLHLQEIPENLEPRNTKAYLLSLFIPFKPLSGESKECAKDAMILESIESCLFLNGRDLFGNVVTTKNFINSNNKESPDSHNLYSWEHGISGPDFLIEIETADGSNFNSPINYFYF